MPSLMYYYDDPKDGDLKWTIYVHTYWTPFGYSDVLIIVLIIGIIIGSITDTINGAITE